MDNGRPQYDIKELADKWLKGTITPEEKAYYENWYKSFDDSESSVQAKPGETLEEMGDRIYGRLQERLQDDEKSKIRRLFTIRRIAAAASIILALSFGGYFILHKRPPQLTAQNQIHDIAPGRNKAILTLTNGKKISLTDARTGTVASQGHTLVNKTADGQVVYSATKSEIDNPKSEIQYNTITTPRGGKWFVTLSDGTKVWLNAASSITYPAAFTGNERKVSITGEAFFEVAHNSAQHFKVVANGQTIEDIGTSFDVNAYADEPDFKTTLVDGSVKISDSNGSVLLKPGQQAQVRANAAIAVIADNDMEKTLAWKNGLFIFNHTDIYTLMRQLSRWYDVDVVYENGVKNDVFFGKIKQDNNLSQILKVLELGDVHFRIEGKKLIVLP